MTRILITGKNCDLSREAFSRAARLAHRASPQTGRAVFHSDTRSDSAAGGTRAPTAKDNRNPEPQSLCTGPESPQTFRLGAITRDDWVLLGVSLLICLANIAIIVLASL